MNERRKTEGKKDATLFLIVKMSVTLPQGHTENRALETSQAGEGHILGAGRGKGQGESRVPGMFYPPGPTWSYPTDADQASHTQPAQVIELLFPELLPPTSLLSVTNKYLPTSRTKGLNLGPPGTGAALESEERQRKQENDQGAAAVRRPLDRFFFFFLNCCARLTVPGSRTGSGPSHKPAVKICVCVFKYIRFHRRPGRGPGA